MRLSTAPNMSTRALLILTYLKAMTSVTAKRIKASNLSQVNDTTPNASRHQTCHRSMIPAACISTVFFNDDNCCINQFMQNTSKLFNDFPKVLLQDCSQQVPTFSVPDAHLFGNCTTIPVLEGTFNHRCSVKKCYWVLCKKVVSVHAIISVLT